MLFLFRLRFGLFSVLHQLGAEADWAALEQSWSQACALGGRGDARVPGAPAHA
jgi:hypothetical protein